jgi:hypothetical protein
MPKAQVRHDRPERPREGWLLDPDDPSLLRWHDGLEFTSERKPRILVAAEDQTNLLHAIRSDIGTIKSIMVTWMVFTVVGLMIGLFIVVGSR